MRLIALVGYKHSGKTTAARHLEARYGFVRHNFKDQLIRELQDNFPDLLELIKQEEYGLDAVPTEQMFVEKPPLIRALMMNYGTEVRRQDDPDYWVFHWKLGLIDYLMNDQTNIVTDDVRFLNEAHAIKAARGTIVRIKRTDITESSNHLSETEQLAIDVDHTIEVGPGEHDKLYAELDEIIAHGGI
jgi:hypothetical protein